MQLIPCAGISCMFWVLTLLFPISLALLKDYYSSHREGHWGAGHFACQKPAIQKQLTQGSPLWAPPPEVRSCGLSKTWATTCRERMLPGTLQEAPVPRRCPDTHRPGSRGAPSHGTSSTFPSSQSPSEAGDRVSHPCNPEDLLPH